MQCKKSKEQLIDEILDNFDFVEVHKAMNLLEWKWYHPSDSSYEVPSIARLVRSAQLYLTMAYDGLVGSPRDNHQYIAGYGGFEAQANRYLNGSNTPDILLTLSFNLAQRGASTYD